MVYNNVFDELDSYMADRASVPDQLRYCIHNYFRVARNEAVKSFDAIASYSIRRVVDLALVVFINLTGNVVFIVFFRNHDKEQEGLVEMYLEWIQEALEYDVFVNDYNCYSNINLQIDQISSFYPNMYPLHNKLCQLFCFTELFLFLNLNDVDALITCLAVTSIFSIYIDIQKS